MAFASTQAFPPRANDNGEEAGLDLTDVGRSQPETWSRCLCDTLAVKLGALRALCLPLTECPQTQIWDRICCNTSS